MVVAGNPKREEHKEISSPCFFSAETELHSEGRRPRGAQGRRRGEGRPQEAARPGRRRPWLPPRLLAGRRGDAESSCSWARASEVEDEPDE